VIFSDDPVEAYVHQMYVSLRTTPREARRIIAEAEDHLRESVAAGGPGAYLSGAIVALAVALGFVPALRRTLLRNAYG